MNPVKQKFYTERYEKEKKYIQMQDKFVAIGRTTPMSAKFYAKHDQIPVSEIRQEYVDLIAKRLLLGPKDIYAYRPPTVNMEYDELSIIRDTDVTSPVSSRYGWFTQLLELRKSDLRLRFPRKRIDFIANELKIRHAHKGLPEKKFTGIPFKV